MQNLKEVENYFNFKLTDSWSDDCDFYIYEETTRDGYSVYIATDDIGNINVNEHIYYYDSDLKDGLIEHITLFNCVKDVAKKKEIIYIDDIYSTFVYEAIEELNELMEQQIEEEND